MFYLNLLYFVYFKNKDREMAVVHAKGIFNFSFLVYLFVCFLMECEKGGLAHQGNLVKMVSSLTPLNIKIHLQKMFYSLKIIAQG